MTASGVSAMLAAKVEKAGGAAALGKEWEVSAQYIRGVVKGTLDPGRLILARLGLERVVSYRAKKAEEM